MANWIKVPARMISNADVKRNEDLNMDIEPETIYGPMFIDTEKITSYSAMYTEEGEPSSQLSEILLDSGLWMAINIPLDKLDNVIRKPTKKVKDE